MMPDILIRDLDSSTVEGLKEQARLHGRSMQAEVRAILEAEVERRRRKEEFFAWADDFRRRQTPSDADSIAIFREGRGYDESEW